MKTVAGREGTVSSERSVCSGPRLLIFRLQVRKPRLGPRK